jgi:uncharacterized protein with PIN domain
MFVPEGCSIMAITCTGCGRQYDVTLFQFGRTIHCTCGRRVGLEHRLSIPEPTGPPRFIADVMLGRLARWLRTLGYDTAHEDSIADADLVRRAFQEGRSILTRDTKLFDEWRVAGGLLVHAESPLEQLAEVVSTFHLERPDRLFTRCRVCNGVLQPLNREDAPGRVPPDIESRAREIAECPGCGRVYWEGSHTDRMRSVLARLWPGPPS